MEASALVRRPDLLTYFTQLAWLVSTRGTCGRRQVGCVLVDARRHVLATGYNGPPAREPHCRDTGGALDRACPGRAHPSGEGLDLCEAVHAEQNALLQCRDAYAIAWCVTTTFPCAPCLKLLLNTSCGTVIYTDDYPGGAQARERWRHRLTFLQRAP